MTMSEKPNETAAKEPPKGPEVIARFVKTLPATPGVYRMLFEVKPYFEKKGIRCFYPYVPVVFEILDTAHYHVPLLLNPYGYSTYRGS